MGTRSLTHIHSAGIKSDILTTIYRQYDGYPQEHGREVAEFLAPLKVVNGLSGETNVANGMECLAAQFIASFKDGPGQIYVYRAGAKDCGEEYTYHVYQSIKCVFPGSRFGKEFWNIGLCIFEGPDQIFDGSPEDFPAWLMDYEAATAEA